MARLDKGACQCVCQPIQAPSFKHKESLNLIYIQKISSFTSACPSVSPLDLKERGGQ